MQKLTERQKIILFAVVCLLFAATAYYTFFRSASKGVENSLISPSDQESQAHGLVLDTPEVDMKALSPAHIKKNDARFQSQIRDIFSLPGLVENPLEKTVPQVLTDDEIFDAQTSLVFKGAILYGKNSMAIINDVFFHLGDLVNGHKLVFISEKEVWIDTQKGIIKIEMMNND